MAQLRMHSTRSFGGWVDKAPEKVASTALYPLEPRAIGTRHVESLSSYVLRLADAHAIRLGDLVGRVLAVGGREQIRLRRYGQGMDNSSDSAARWVSALAAATGITNIQCLTFIDFRHLLPRSELLRPNEAWCSRCWMEARQSGHAVYTPLLWRVRLVRSCDIHHCRLQELCPQCGSGFPPLLSDARPGLCPYCCCRLDEPDGSTTQTTSTDDADKWLAVQTAELITSADARHSDAMARLRTNLSSIARTINGSAPFAALASVSGLSRHIIEQAVTGPARIPLPVLFRIASSLGLSIVQLIKNAASDSWRDGATIVAASQRWSDLKPRSRLKNEAALRAALEESPAPSLRQVAERLGYVNPKSLCHLHQAVCTQIVRRFRSQKRGRGVPPSSERVVRVLESELTCEDPASLPEIARRLGYASDETLRHRYPALCAAIIDKRKERRRVWRESLSEQVRVAVRENPPPSLPSLAKRIGCTHHSLKAHAPTECAELVSARQAWKQRRRAADREMFTVLRIKLGPVSPQTLCAAAGLPIRRLMAHPDLFEHTSTEFRVAQREHAESRLRCLKAEVERIVDAHRVRGLSPSFEQVRQLLGNGHPRDSKVIWYALREVRKSTRREDRA